jgi:hypothetical protein
MSIHERRAAGLAVLAVLLLLAATGCGRRERTVMPVTIDERIGSAAPRHPQDFSSHEAVVRGVAAILRRDFGLPVPEQVTLYLYASRALFERGLVDDGLLAPVRAAELGEFAVAVGQRRQLLLHNEGAPPSSRYWLKLIAHELTHVAQIELAGREGQAEQWLTEGMAEWVAFAVLERLALDTLADRRAIAHGEIREYPALYPGRLDLVTLGTPRGYATRLRRDGSQATYQLAFLMSDHLVQRHGFDQLLVYYRGFAAGRSRFENFYAAFGQSLPDFETEMVSRLGHGPR